MDGQKIHELIEFRMSQAEIIISSIQIIFQDHIMLLQLAENMIGFRSYKNIFNALAFIVIILSEPRLALANKCDSTNLMIVSTAVSAQTRHGVTEYQNALRSIPLDPNVILLGDSIANGWGKTPDSFPGYRVFNYGVSSDRIQNVLWRLSNPVIAGLRPKKIILMLGTNNMVDAGMDACSVVAGIVAVIERARMLWPNAVIYTFSILPRGADFKDANGIRIEINKSLKEALENKKNVKFVQVPDEEFTCGRYAEGVLPGSTFACAPNNAYSCNNYQKDNVHPSFTGYASLKLYLSKVGFFE